MKKLTKKEIIEQRKQFPRVLVSDDNVNWIETILLFQCDNRLCVCVEESNMDKFEKGEHFDTEYFDYWKPLPQKKQVPFEHGKEIDWDWKFRRKDSNKICSISSLGNAICLICDKERAGSRSFENLFNKYLLSKDNGVTWQFAGKEIEEE